MKTGTARQGMRVRIIGNHNSHGFDIGQIVRLEERTPYAINRYGYSFYVPYLRSRFAVREIDMEPVNATLV